MKIRVSALKIRVHCAPKLVSACSLNKLSTLFECERCLRSWLNDGD